MIEYNYLEDLSLMEVNSLGLQDWEIVGVAIKSLPPPLNNSYDVFLKRGRQGYSMIEVDSETKFYIDKSYNLGDSIIIIFATIFLFAVISKAIYGWLFSND